MEQSKVLKLTVLLLGLSFAIFICTVFFYDRLSVRYFLVWNLFLAAVPLLAAWGLYVCRNNKFCAAVFFLLWLLFFPNGPYMITDLIHLNRYYYHRPTLSAPIYFDDWLGLAHLSAGVFVGLFLGLLSLYMVHVMIRRQKSSLFGWCFIGIICAVSGVALYIGRFMRFNSWDAFLNPGSLLFDLHQQDFTEFISFSLLFAVMTGVFYMVFYTCMGYKER